MLIRELFYYDVDRDIDTVIKVGDRGEKQMAEELKEYITTETIELELIRFLEAYVESRPGQPGAGTDDIGVWISGFFGSGKSHFAKIISYLLTNPTVEGRTAHEWLLHRVAGSPREGEIAGLLAQLRNYLESETIVFQIKAEQDLINPDSITEIMYRQYLKSRGLSETPWIGRFELELIEQGKFDKFKEEVAALEGQTWEEGRDDYLLVRSSIVRALRKVFPGRFSTDVAADKALDDIKENLRLSPADLARELTDYVQMKDEHFPQQAFHLAYIVDEVGQFIGDDGQKLLELQSIAETFASQGGGRLWLLVTAQAALEDVVEGVQQVRADYARIMDRFALHTNLTSENVEEVLEERILKKLEQHRPLLRDLFRDHKGNLVEIASLDAQHPVTVPDAERFFRTYPFFPYHFDLMQEAFASLRAKGGSTTQLTGGERSLLGVTKGVLAAPGVELADEPVGTLVRLDQLYDQIVKEVPGSDRRAINEVAEQPYSGAIHPGDALKALFILQHVDWINASLDNVTRVLMDDVKVSLNQKRAEVKAALEVLVNQQYASESDGIYKYLSAAERDIEQEIASEPVKNAQVRRTARELLSDLLKGTGQLNYNSGTATFDFRIVADGEEIRSRGDITLAVYSPISVEFGNLDPEIVRDVESPHEPMTAYWLPAPVTGLAPDFRRLIRIDNVLDRRTSRTNLDRVEAIILRDKERDAEALRARLQSAVRRALTSGTIVYQGDVSDLGGRTNSLNVIFNRELSDVIPAVYTKFYLADVKVVERSIGEMLTARKENLPAVEPDLHLWDTSGPEPRINTTTAVVGEILAELKRRKEQGRDLSGSAIVNHFEAVPYGWNPTLVRIVLAALFRAGRITIEFEGKRYSDPTLKVTQDALTKARTFGRARFLPAKGLSLEERREAQAQLDLLFDRKVDDTPNTLASTLQEALSALVGAGDRLQWRTSAVGLPVKDRLYHGSARATKVLDEPDQTARIRDFLKAADELADYVRYQEEVARFVDAGRLDLFERSRALLDVVEKAQGYAEELQAAPIPVRLQDMRHILREREVVERWDHYHACYQEVLSAYQTAYRRLFAQRSEIYRAIRDQLQQFTDDVPDVVTGRIAEGGPGYWTENGLRYEGVRADLADLYLEIQSAHQVKAEAIQRLQTRSSPPPTGDETTPQPKPPAYVKVTSVVPQTTLENEEQLREALDAVEKVVRGKLDEGRTVILG